MAGGKRDVDKGGQQGPAAPATTVWDRLHDVGVTKTMAERLGKLGPIVAHAVQSQDINPLLDVLGDTRPPAQQAAIMALMNPETFGFYQGKPDWLGAVAARISNLLTAPDQMTQMVAATAVYYLLGWPMDDQSKGLIRQNAASARGSTSLPIGPALALSLIEDRF